MPKNEPRITVDGKTAPCPECHISGDHKMSCSRGGSKGARFTMRMEHAADAVTMLQRMHACVVLSENHGDVPRIGSDEVLAVLRATQAERARHAEEVARLEERLAGSCEAEELRSGLEKLMADRGPLGTDAVSRDSLQALLDKVDARDSLLTLETIDSLRDQLRRAEGERDKKQELLDKLALDLGAAYDHGNALERELKWVTAARDLARTERDSLRSLLPDVRACARFTYRAAAEGQLVPEFSSAQKLLAADFLREPCPECHMVERCKMNCSRGGSKGGRFSVSLDSQGEEGE